MRRLRDTDHPMAPRRAIVAVCIWITTICTLVEPAASTAADDDAITALRRDLEAARRRVEAIERALDASTRHGDAPVRDPKPDPDPSTFALADRFDPAAVAEPRPLDRPVRAEHVGRLVLSDDGLTTLRLGGFLKFDAITDLDPVGARDWFVPSTIPTDTQPASQRGPSTGFSARATRLQVQWRRETEHGPVVFFFEQNFFGRDTDDFRAGRTFVNPGHVYGQWGPWTAGRTFSLWMDIDAYPDTLDFYGPNAALFAFNAQLRYARTTNRAGTFAMSIENPRSQIGCTTLPGCGPRDRAPDVVGRWRIDGGWGHAQVAGLWRHVGAGDATGTSVSATAGGLHASGSLKLVPDRDLLVGGVWVGRGVQRYINDLNYAGGHDGAIAMNGDFALAQAAGGHLGLTHQWTDRYRSTVVASVVNNETLPGQPDRTPAHSTYLSANWVWSPHPAFALGAEVLHGTVRTRAAGEGAATRVMVSAQVRFTP